MREALFWLSRKINFPLIPPQIIQVSVTYRCNLRCKMCSIANSLPPEDELATAQIFRIIDEAKNYGIKEVLLTGGEPFLREDIFTICGYCYKKGLKSIITTNGAIINEHLAENIAKSKINHVHFSLDGLEETHDFFRGRNVFSKVIKAVDILNKERINNHCFSMGVACTVMDNNVKELSEIVRLADNLNIDIVNFQPLVNDNSNFLDKNLPLFWVKEENVPILEQEIEEIRKYKPKHINIYEEPRLELLIKYYKRELAKKDWACFGGFKTVFICFEKKEPLVYSCHGICGNLDKISLREAWTSKEARKLRLHSQNCNNLCMQSCYSQEAFQSLHNLAKFYYKSILKRNG